MKGDRLSLREERFCQAFAGQADGNALRAYELAGYSTNGTPASVRRSASKMRHKPQIIARLDEIAASTPLVMSRRDLQQFLCKVIEDRNEDMRHRLKAAELFGKSIGAYTENVAVDVTARAQVVIELPDNGRLPPGHGGQ